MDAHEQYEHQILNAIDASQSLSQRSLASSLGIALGLTNLLVRRLVRKGWVRVTRIKPNRVGYFLTPAGVAEKTRLSRLYLQVLDTLLHDGARPDSGKPRQRRWAEYPDCVLWHR